jgi:hypothetical protein
MQISSIYLADLALVEGNLVEARHWLTESMELSAKSLHETEWRPIHRSMLAARIAAAEGRDQRAAQLYGFMQALVDSIKIGPYSPVIDTAVQTLAEVRARMGDEAYERAYQEGRLLPLNSTLSNLLAFDE